MAKYYVKTKEVDADGRRYFTDDLPVLDSADGLTEVTVPDVDQYPQYFLLFWNKGYYLDENDQIVSPGNLPDLTIGYLRDVINRQGIQLDSAVSTANDLKKLTSNLTLQQTQLNSTLTEAQTTIKQLQGMAGSLTLQIATLQSKQTTETEAK